MQLHSRDANRYTLIQLSYESGEISGSLRPAIQVELNFARLREATISLPVASFVAEAFSRPPEIASIDCVSVTETAAEKLVSLTRRTAMQIAGISREPDPTLVRHIYDLHMDSRALQRGIRRAIGQGDHTARCRGVRQSIQPSPHEARRA